MSAREVLLKRALDLARRLERLESETAHQERASRAPLELRSACPAIDALLKETAEKLEQVRHDLLDPEADATAPSMGEAIRADHAGLRRLLAPIQELAERFDPKSPPSPEATASAVVLLSDFERELIRHFAFEESSGPLEEALRVAPQHQRRAAALERDHEILRERAARLLEHARVAGSSAREWSDVWLELEEFVALLFEHEAVEDAIIADALLEDHGGG